MQRGGAGIVSASDRAASADFLRGHRAGCLADPGAAQGVTGAVCHGRGFALAVVRHEAGRGRHLSLSSPTLHLIPQCSIYFSKTKRMRREASAVAACFSFETAVYYSLLVAGQSVHSCIVPLGGASTENVRMHSIGRYVYWMCSTPPIVAMVGQLGGSSPGNITRAVIADIVIMLSGLAASQDRCGRGVCVCSEKGAEKAGQIQQPLRWTTLLEVSIPLMRSQSPLPSLQFFGLVARRALLVPPGLCVRRSFLNPIARCGILARR